MAIKKQVNSPSSSQILDLSDLHFTQFADKLPQGIRIIDINNNIKYVNAAFAKISGVSSIEAIDKKCYAIYPSPFCHTAECRLKRIVGGEEAILDEIQRTRKNGSPVPCLVTALPFYAQDNQLIGIIETFSDMTSEKKLESRAIEAEDRYRAIVELTKEVGEGILMLQDIGYEEGAIVFASPQCSRITGYTNEELLNMTLFDLVHRRDLEATRDRHRRKMNGESLPGLYTITIINKEGTEVPIELTSAVTQYKFKPANIVYFRDTSEKTKAERALKEERERYHTLFENAPIAIAEVDFSGAKKIFDDLKQKGVIDFQEYFDINPTEVNECYSARATTYFNRRYFELNESENIKSLTQCKVNALNDCDEYWETCKKSMIDLAEGRNKLSREATIITQKGNIRKTQEDIIVAPGYENTLSRVLIFHFDITGLKKKEDELRMYKEHLEDLVKERTAELTLSQQQLKKEVDQRILFTHALVHELNTPLTPMLGAGELLANNIKQEPFSAFAKNLNLGIQQLNQRVKDLLDLSRGEAGLLHMRFEIVNVKDVAHQALQYIELEAKSYEQKLQLKIPDNLPMIIADEDRLNQVLLNLISNSIKYSSGPDIILITIRRKGDDIIFSVYDRGIGMDAETLEQSTRPYYQYNENTKGGLGLGLSLCKIIVELHGGKLHITSKKNVGTTVSFSIPINTNKKPL